MKPLLIALTLLATVFTTSSFASGTKVSPTVLKSFKSQFTTAQEVDWSVTQTLYKAQFTINGQYAIAYYEPDGTMVAVTRNISSTQLPIALQGKLQKNCANYWISDLFEVTNEDGTTYYVTLENADEKIIMKSSTSTGWSNFKKLRKA